MNRVPFASSFPIFLIVGFILKWTLIISTTRALRKYADSLPN